MSPITSIEVSFAIPIELTKNEQYKLHDLVSSIARRTQPEGYVHWLAGIGSKPHFSLSDSVFLNRVSGALNLPPVSEEPTWDDSVYYLETCCREK